MATEIEELCAKATPRPWAHRPCEHDDWGFIRGPEIEMSFGPGRPIAAIAGAGHPYDANEHRRNNTDPCEPNAVFIVHAVNNIERLTADNEALREALRWVEPLLEEMVDDSALEEPCFALCTYQWCRAAGCVADKLKGVRAALSEKGKGL